jgi:hypothetical protein
MESGESAMNRVWRTGGATSNALRIARNISQGECDDRIGELIEQGFSEEEVAWKLIDELVKWDTPSAGL